MQGKQKENKAVYTSVRAGGQERRKSKVLPTDRPTDRVGHRVACTRLKMRKNMKRNPEKMPLKPTHTGLDTATISGLSDQGTEHGGSVL